MLGLGVLWVAQSLSGQQENLGDVLVAGDPRAFRVFDEYEQPVVGAIPPFAPMRIVSGQATLSDGFTSVMRVEVMGRPFAIQLDHRGGPATSGSAGPLRYYRNVAIRTDSVVVRDPSRLSFTPADRERRSVGLAAGEHLRRFFSVGGRDYVMRTGTIASFGWATLGRSVEGSAWSVLNAGTGQGLPEPLLRAAAEKLRKVNRVLRILHGYFSKETGRTIPAPAWRAEARAGTLTCILTSDSSGYEYPESTRLIARNLEQYLIGTDLRIIVTPGRIEVRRGS